MPEEVPGMIPSADFMDMNGKKYDMKWGKLPIFKAKRFNKGS